MAWKMAGKKSDKCMEALRKLSKEEILEVLEHDGFCADCQARLDTRLQNLLNTRMGKISIQNDGVGDAAKSGTQIEPLPEGGERKHKSFGHSGSDILLNNGLCKAATSEMDYETSEEQQERIRLSQVGRKRDFVHFERVNGKSTNILQGLELHTRIFNEEEQNKIVDCVYALQHMGEKGQLRERTFSAPKKWMRGKGRVTLQFGCCYNYAMDKSGNPPGIVRDEKVDPLPPLFKKMIRRMVRWNVLPATCIPNSCIVNIYDEGDCIPPHIDHHDFLRPFCTVSFLSECKILFGSSLKVVDAGEFTGPVSIPLPVGSVFILSGNGADVARHCVPGVPAKRISITFRKMDDSKLPQGFSPDPELLGIKPITKSPAKSPVQQYPSPTSKSPVQQYSTPTSKSPVQQYSTPTSKSPVQQYSTPPGHSVLSSHYQKNHHQDNKPLHSESDFPPLSASPANQRNGSKAKQNK